MDIKAMHFLAVLLALVLVVSADEKQQVENKVTAENSRPKSAKTIEESKWGGGGGCYQRCCGYYGCRCCAENAVAPNEAVFMLNEATGQYEPDYHGGGWGGGGGRGGGWGGGGRGGGWGGGGMDQVDHYGGGGGWGGGGRGGGWGGGGGRGGGWGGGGRGGGWGGGGGMDQVDHSGGGGPP